MKKKAISELEKLLHLKLAMYAGAMSDAKLSAQSETKSSAGDKYETARSMSQMEFDMQNAQYQKVKLDLSLLQQVKKLSQQTTVAEGSLVNTNFGWYFIAISFGKININGIEVISLSKNTPLAKAMIGKRQDSSFLFNGQNYCIVALE